MKYVFIVEHSYIDNGITEVKGIGVYASEDEAAAAIERSRPCPGFCDYPDGFYIKKCEIDKDDWNQEFSIIKEIRENKSIKQNKTAPYIFVLMHNHELYGETPQIIGVYSSQKKARSIIRKIYKSPEFFKNLEGFEIETSKLDHIICHTYSLSDVWSDSLNAKQNAKQYIYLVECKTTSKTNDQKEIYIGCGFFSTQERAEQFVQKELSDYLSFKEYQVNKPAIVQKIGY